MKNKSCAYCGKITTKTDKEHVFPKCLYPKRESKVQRLTVPSCRDCNSSWSEDEAHFRNVLVVAGEQTAAREKLWKTTVYRSFREIDGSRRARDLVERLKPVHINNEIGYMIYPGQDERVLRVARKIIRGLCHYHEIMSDVSDYLVRVDVLKYLFPQEVIDDMKCHHRERDIAEYRYQVFNEGGINSVWLLTFYEKVTFLGIVDMPRDEKKNQKFDKQN